MELRVDRQFQLPDRFGLLDSSPGHWENFKLKIENLNSECGSDDSVKVLFLGRHGEGYRELRQATPYLHP